MPSIRNYKPQHVEQIPNDLTLPKAGPLLRQILTATDLALQQMQRDLTAAGITTAGTSTTVLGQNALLDGVNHTDTLAGTVVRGDLIVGNSTPAWARYALGTVGKIIRSDGTDALWSATTWPNVGTSGGLLYFSSTTDVASSALLAASALILGGGAGVAPATLGSLGTATTVLHGNAGGAPTFGAVSLTADVTGDLPFANLAQGSGLSVLGVTGTITADVASIVGTADQVLRVAAAAASLGFGSIDLSKSAAVGTSILPIANGGTNSSTALSGSSIAISNGSAIVQGALGTTTTLLHGNAGGAPSYSAVSLTADVTGVLPIANGGTNNSSAYTAGSVIFSSGTALTQDNANLFWDDTNNRFGIGTAVPSYRLDLVGTTDDLYALNLTHTTNASGAAAFNVVINDNRTDTVSTAVQGFAIGGTWGDTNPGANNTSAFYGANVDLKTAIGGSTNYNSGTGFVGHVIALRHRGTGLLSTMRGMLIQTLIQNTGSVTSMRGLTVGPWLVSSSGSVTGIYSGVFYDSPVVGGTGTISDCRAINIKKQQVAGVTIGYGVYQEDSGDTNYFNGKVGLGSTAPTNTLSFGGAVAQTMWMERRTAANTAGNSLTIQSGGAASGATNKAAGNLILASGISTGSGNGQILLQTPTTNAASTTDNTLVTRMTIDGTGVSGVESMNILVLDGDVLTYEDEVVFFN